MRESYFFLLIVGMLHICGSATAQEHYINDRINLKVDNKSLVEILYLMEQDHGYRFCFDPEKLPYYPLTKNYTDKQVWDILRDLLNGTALKAIEGDEEYVAIIDRKNLNREKLTELLSKWKSGEYAYPFDTKNATFSYSIGEENNAPSSALLKLRIEDTENNIPIIGAVVRNVDLSINGVTDTGGNLTLQVPTGGHNLLITYTGYQSIDLSISIYEDAEINLPIVVQSFMLDEVQIVANTSRQKMEEGKAGLEILDISKLEIIPQALGETDIIKSLEMLPGVTSVGEISSGFNVRGGSIDESLVLLNDAMIFNPTHVIGFISAFNSDIIKTASLSKAYVDPEYGGRSSAILNLKSHPKVSDKIHGKGGIGTSVLRLMLEGPLSDKLDFQVSGRGSFSDWLLGRIPNVEIQNSSAQFYDLNATLRYRINDTQKIDLHSYYSDDFFQFNTEFGFEWNNLAIGAAWSGSWSDKWYGKASLNYGAYNNAQLNYVSPLTATFTTGLSYIKGIASLTRTFSSESSLKVGVEMISYNQDEDRLIPGTSSAVEGGSIQRKAAVSLSPFLVSSIKLTPSISLESGLRFSSYLSTGPGEIFFYEDGFRSPESITSEETLTGTDPEGNYLFLEPRISINYKVKENWAINGGVNRLTQNTQLLSISNTALPTDFWIFSDRYIRPQDVWQYSAGMIHNDGDNRYSLSLDGFYKDINHTYVLKDFPEVVLNPHLETELIAAQGKSYGIECFLEKSKGAIVGSIAYTYTRTFRQTNDPFQQVNNNQEFPANFDIPHQLNLIITYKLLPSFSLNLAYVYKSGRPITQPIGTILIDNFPIPLYSERNEARIPHYERVDFSLTLDMRNSKNSGFRSSFTLGFYNLLGRRNPFNVFYRRQSTGNIVPFQFAIIGSMVPSISWNFVF